MPRPMKWRNVCSLPEYNEFGPLGLRSRSRETVEMTVDEYETIRLMDLEGLTQEECAKQMNIARTSVTATYAEARHKAAMAIVEGKRLVIEGGNYRICEGNYPYCRRGRQRGCEPINRRMMGKRRGSE